MGGSSWKVAYADFVTAMMAFFLLMWILGMTPPETKQGLAAYFAEGTLSSNISSNPNAPYLQKPEDSDSKNLNISEVERSHLAIANKIKQMLMADAVPQSSTGISTDDVGVLLRVNSDSTFESGKATLTPEGEKIMGSVLDILNEYNLYLVIRGHADKKEVTKDSPFRSNWELSGARATAIAEYLVEHGIKSSRIRAVGYADTRPLEPNFDGKVSEKNRRVEFYFHRPEVMSYGVVY